MISDEPLFFGILIETTLGPLLIEKLSATGLGLVGARRQVIT